MLLPSILIAAITLLVMLAVLAAWRTRPARVLARSNAFLVRGDRRKAITVIEEELARCGLSRPRSHAILHFHLAYLYLLDGRLQEAVDQARSSLVPGLPVNLESTFRSRLADCLEACGEVESSEKERGRANDATRNAPPDAANLLVRAAALRKAGRFSESIPLYEEAIAQSQQAPVSARAHMMISRAASCREAGHVHDSLAWAERAIALGPNVANRLLGYGSTALALGSLGRLDEAEERWKLAFDVAMQLNNEERGARYLACLAEIQRRRGQLVEAAATCERAASMSIPARQAALGAAFECFMAWGKLSDAREMLEQSARAQPFALPSDRRRISALIALNRGLLDAEEGKLESAIHEMDQASTDLECDERLGVLYHSVRAWIEAELGRSEESRLSGSRAAEALRQKTDDRNAAIAYHIYVGRADLANGNPESALSQFTAVKNFPLDPVTVPRIEYFIGEAQTARGDLVLAARNWTAAVDTGLATRYTELSRQRLAQVNEGAATAAKEPSERP